MPMKLLITIDTEEDNWNRYSATENPVENIEALKDLQFLFDRYGVRPTYLITYPVASNPLSIDTLRRISDKGNCEIGMHCHPWNTPPFGKNGIIEKRDTMLCNLANDVVDEKMSFLHTVIEKNFGIVPVSFRAGRYGFGPQAAKALCRLGYRVDTSVTPYSSWVSNNGVDYTTFSPQLFRFGEQGLQPQTIDGPLLQVPVSIGYLQSNFKLCRRIESHIDQGVPRFVHLKGIFEKLRILNKGWLSPELSTTDLMIQLAKRFEQRGSPCVNMTFHSSSLKAGNSPFTQDLDAQKMIFRRIERFIRFTCASGWESQTLSEFADSFTQQKVQICSTSTYHPYRAGSEKLKKKISNQS